MHITLSPVRHHERPVFEKQGDSLIIDGETFDFSVVPEGATLPADAVASDWIIGPVTRENGVIHLTLMLSHGAKAPQGTMFPDPVLASNGEIPLPAYEEEQEA